MTSNTDVSPELIERMIALVRKVSSSALEGGGEARAIVALLPKPVDPDVLVARKICADRLCRLGASAEMIASGDIANGNGDDTIIMHATLAAIKRGRELERQSPQVTA